MLYAGMVGARRKVAVVGGGPAGLRAAEVASKLGAAVTLYDHKRSVGRKFLVAGKSGLNLTNAAGFEVFTEQYAGGEGFSSARWREYLEAFDNAALRAWASQLGVETFIASGGKVFPESKKAAPLLRRWVMELKSAGVDFRMNCQWVGFRCEGDALFLEFQHRGEVLEAGFDAVVLAMGGASWPETGSDGSWASILETAGVAITKLKSANNGWECDWADSTRAIAEGQPLHHLAIQAGDSSAEGELMVTRYGFEGTPIYRLGSALRAMEAPELVIDFKPMFSVEHMVKKMESARRHFFREARLRWKLSEAVCAIIEQYYGQFASAQRLAEVAKHCCIPLKGPRPVEEAISTAGGVSWAELDARLMLKALPGVYCAGEMIDWEAPTGGYLIQGCFVTGTVAGRAAADSQA
ncbi:MAG: TIGR03862 family flavoprotein [Verrucomicrobiota bacterium]